MRKHSPVFIICDDLIITDWQCFCIFIVQKNGETQTRNGLEKTPAYGYTIIKERDYL